MKRSTTLGPVFHAIRWPLRLTWAGLWAESVLRAAWPLISLGLLAFAAVGFGLPDHLTLDLAWYLALVGVGAVAGAVFYARRHFLWPSRNAALARLDAQIEGQPLAALHDDLAIGIADKGAVAVWQAHQQRMAQKLIGLRAVAPNLRLSAADPFALRYGALLLAMLAVLFGGPVQWASIGGAQNSAKAPSGPMWEAWATPPAYTGKPALYFADLQGDELALPLGTRLDLRLYGAPGDVIVDETLSARTNAVEIAQQNQSFPIAQSGYIRFVGQGGREFAITALPDAPPTIMAGGALVRRQDARFALPFKVKDDYGIAKGHAHIALNLPAVSRQYGLLADPDALPQVTLDLPLPRRGGRVEFSETLVDDLSKSLLSNLPVTITLHVTDAAGQTGQSAPILAVLPGKRFFDPLAAALVEMRRDLLWSASNTPRSVQILKAIIHEPDTLVDNQRAYLRLRAVIKALNNNAQPDLETLAEELWQIALLIEEGDLATARDKLTRAQDRLDEAIRKGASPEEIEKLMQDMRQALKDYTRELAQKQRDSGDQMSQDQRQSPGQTMTQDQLAQLMQRLQDLMEQGKTAEAAELMQRLRELMDNMQIAQGEAGRGEGSGQGGGPSQQAMRELGDTLRDQQRLADEAYRNFQQGGDGQSQSELDEGDPAQRQQQLRERLGQLQQDGQLPGAGTEQGQAGQQALDDAARAMENAEDALRQGDLPRALDGQAEALQDLRQSLSQFGQALAEEQRQGGQALGNLGQDGGSENQIARDPLGRQTGTMLRNGSDNNLLENQDINRRAEDLLNEIRRRLGQQDIPEGERSYLNRLLDLF